MKSHARYNVLTWDCEDGQFTEQGGMINLCLDVSISGLRRALRELRCDFGYECHRQDSAVLVERLLLRNAEPAEAEEK